MRRLPLVIALGFVGISLIRVGQFVADGLQAGFIGWIFSVMLAAGVFTSAYYTRPRQTRFWAIMSLIVFGLVDGIFNEIELARTLSVNVLLPPEANFMSWAQADIVWAIQLCALIFGGFQTVAAGLLGFLQSGVEKLPFKAAEKSRVSRVLGGLLADGNGENNGGDAHGSKRGAADSTKGFNAGRGKQNGDAASKSAANNGEGRRRNELTAAEKEAISAMTPRQVMANYGGSIRRAREWKQAAREGTL